MRRFMAGILGLSVAFAVFIAVFGIFALIMLFFAVIADLVLLAVPFVVAGAVGWMAYTSTYNRTRGPARGTGYLDNTGFFVSVRRRRAQEALDRLRTATPTAQESVPHDRQRTVQL